MAPDIKEAVHALSRKMAEEKDPAQLALLKQQLRRLFRRAMPIQRGRRPASDAGRLADDTGGNRQHKKDHTSGDRTILCIAASFSRPRLALALKAALSSSIAFRNSSELSGAAISQVFSLWTTDADAVLDQLAYRNVLLSSGLLFSSRVAELERWLLF